jgi:hypothetical protein
MYKIWLSQNFLFTLVVSSIFLLLQAAVLAGPHAQFVIVYLYLYEYSPADACGHLVAGVAGSNLALGMYVCCVYMLCCPV